MKKKRIILCLLILCLLLSGVPTSMVRAASATVTLSLKGSDVKLNDTFYVVVKVDATASIGGFETFLSYDEEKIKFIEGGDVVTGDDGVLRISDMNPENLVKSRTYLLQFQAIEQGNVSIESMDQAYVYTYEDSAEMSVSCNSLSIPIGTDETVSNNTDLHALKISPGKLSPSFSTGVAKYTTKVGEDVDKIIISAVASDAGAKVVTTGNNKLEPGPNQVNVIVTAPSGDKRVYTIIVTREGEKKVEEEKKDEEGTLDTEQKDDSFYQDAINHNGMFITQDEKTVSLNFASEYTLVKLKDETLIPDGYEADVMNLQENDIEVYKKTGESKTNRVLLYVSRQGEKPTFYQLDLKDYTIQKYESEVVQQPQKTVDAAKSKEEEKLYTMKILLIVTCSILLIYTLVLIKMVIKYKYKDEDDL